MIVKTSLGCSAALVMCVLFVTGCKDDVLTTSGKNSVNYTSIGTIIYSIHIQPIFDQSCNTSGCHNASFGAAGLLLDSWPHLFLGTPSGAQIVSGNAFMSHMMRHINTDTNLSPVS